MLNFQPVPDDLKTCEFDCVRDTEFAHFADGFDHVLHIFNDGWHGIRAAAGYCPGHKLAISESAGLDGEALRHIVGLVHKYRIQKVVFQAYSSVASDLCRTLKKDFGADLDCYAITHVTSTQFENHFEIEMQATLRQQKASGLIAGLGSVKPDFHTVIDDYWPGTILNYAPNTGANFANLRVMEGAVFIPIENTWRKNLYTNMLAAIRTPTVETIYTVNFPTGLETLCDVSKITLTPYRKRHALLSFMAAVEVQMNVTMAECQPMTQLEALAVGTPCLTGALRMHEFADDPLLDLTEVAALDTPRYIGEALAKVIDLRRNAPEELRGMIDDHLTRRHRLATQSYADFLDL